MYQYLAQLSSQTIPGYILGELLQLQEDETAQSLPFTGCLRFMQLARDALPLHRRAAQ